MQQVTQSEPQPTTDHNAFRPKPPKRHPQKITQIQCMENNYQLKNFFILQLSDSFKYLPHILSAFYLELQTLIGFLEFRLTIAKDLPHPGDHLQNIQYKFPLSQSKKLLYLLLTVILPYARRRLQVYLMKDEQTGWKRWTLQFLNMIQKISSLLEFINFSIFIWKGHYRSLVQRILQMKMQFINSERTRILNFSLMNRRLIWSIYELFLKTVLPYTHDMVSKSLKNIFYLQSYMEVDKSEMNNCIFCKEKPHMGVQAQPCKHLACYYCMTANFSHDKKQECAICGEIIVSWKKLYE